MSWYWPFGKKKKIKRLADKIRRHGMEIEASQILEDTKQMQMETQKKAQDMTVESSSFAQSMRKMNERIESLRSYSLVVPAETRRYNEFSWSGVYQVSQDEVGKPKMPGYREQINHEVFDELLKNIPSVEPFTLSLLQRVSTLSNEELDIAKKAIEKKKIGEPEENQGLVLTQERKIEK